MFQSLKFKRLKTFVNPVKLFFLSLKRTTCEELYNKVSSFNYLKKKLSTYYYDKESLKIKKFHKFLNGSK